MDWVTCPQCGFTQIPTEKCLRCGRPQFPLPDEVPASDRETVRAEPVPDGVGREAAALAPPPAPSKPDVAATNRVDVPGGQKLPLEGRLAPPAPAAPPVSAVSSPPPGPAAPASPTPSARPAAARPRPASALPPGPTTRPALPPPARRGPLLAAAGVIIVVVVALWVALGRGPSRDTAAVPTPAAPAVSPVLDLSGRWEAQFPKTLVGPPPRPALKQTFLETDRDGSILAAGVLLTDPGRGGAGAGYRIVSDGPQRLGSASAALATSPAGVALPQVDFIPFPAWIPTRERVWRVLEGQSRRILDVRYVLLESVEDDYLVQAGITRSGFCSYAFFSKEYARGRGLDSLSGIIHPDPGSSLRGFRNLVWDFSGAADFLSLDVSATLSGPEGGPPDRLTLKRPAK